jgi:7-cyano-7-deazaguanine synthase
MGKQKKGLILLSGGQDSTTCLAWALNKFETLEAITFDYGQRHRIELESAALIAKKVNIPLRLQKLDLFKDLTNSALTNSKIEITEGDKNSLPSTFVPGRNLIFLSTAAIHAHQNGISELITGVCETDYSGYPDCRENFVKSLEESISLALDTKINIHTPLMHLNKAQSVEMMKQLGQLELLKHSHTCYKGNRPACGNCPSCQLRLKGFKDAGIIDPIQYEQQ